MNQTSDRKERADRKAATSVIYTKADDGLRQPCGLVFSGRRGHVPWLRKFFAHGNGMVPRPAIAVAYARLFFSTKV